MDNYVKSPGWGYFGHIGEVPCDIWVDDVLQLVGDCGLNTIHEAMEAWNYENKNARMGELDEYNMYKLAATAVRWETEDMELSEYELDGDVPFLATEREHEIVNKLKHKYIMNEN